jgi:predicted nuclease of predicted toxin-antitoxin system
MKFIVDAQLPRRLARWLREKGFDTVHTLDLPARNRTDDDDINALSMAENRVVISKDSDFYDRFFEKLEPHKLLFLTTGNIRNDDLIALFDKNLGEIVLALTHSNVVELSRHRLITIA